MKKVETLTFLIVSCFVARCNYIGAGTLGGFPKITFQTKKINVEKSIETLYGSYPEYRIPEKWEYKDNWTERGYGFLEGRIFYFSSFPEEMYYVSFIGGSDINTVNSASVAIRAITNESNGWLLYHELSEDKRAQVVRRFHDEIVLKLEDIIKIKSIQENKN